jgi:hypothetical protein
MPSPAEVRLIMPSPRRGSINHGVINHAEPRRGSINHGVINHAEPRRGSINHGVINHAEPRRGSINGSAAVRLVATPRRRNSGKGPLGRRGALSIIRIGRP